MHAIGDRAVTEALDAFEDTGARGGIEHVQLDRRATTYAAWRGSASAPACSPRTSSTTATSPSGSGPAGPSAASRCAGCSTTASTSSSAPTPRSRRSTRGWPIAAAVHRTGDDREPWHPEQSITAARGARRLTDGWGTVAPGHPADLVLLDADPLDGGVDARARPALRAFADHVVATWVDGRRRTGARRRYSESALAVRGHGTATPERRQARARSLEDERAGPRAGRRRARGAAPRGSARSARGRTAPRPPRRGGRGGAARCAGSR